MNLLDNIEVFSPKKKSEEESERAWCEFTKEQERLFDELLVERGLKSNKPCQWFNKVIGVSNS